MALLNSRQRKRKILPDDLLRESSLAVDGIPQQRSSNTLPAVSGSRPPANPYAQSPTQRTADQRQGGFSGSKYGSNGLIVPDDDRAYQGPQQEQDNPNIDFNNGYEEPPPPAGSIGDDGTIFDADGNVIGYDPDADQTIDSEGGQINEEDPMSSGGDSASDLESLAYLDPQAAEVLRGLLEADYTAREEALREQNALSLGQSLADANAVASMGGLGLTGAQAAGAADIRGASQRNLTNQLLDLEDQRRAQQMEALGLFDTAAERAFGAEQSEIDRAREDALLNAILTASGYLTPEGVASSPGAGEDPGTSQGPPLQGSPETTEEEEQVFTSVDNDNQRTGVPLWDLLLGAEDLGEDMLGDGPQGPERALTRIDGGGGGFGGNVSGPQDVPGYPKIKTDYVGPDKTVYVGEDGRTYVQWH